MSNPNPEAVFQALKGKMKSNRSLRSLQAINDVCREHREAGALDFRVATIVRLGSSRGVPSEQTIKNKTGEPYRTLIKAWQDSLPQKPKISRKRDDWVSDIDDPRIRYLVEDLVAKNRKLEQQISILKRAEFTIDMRDIDIIDKEASVSLPNLIDSELIALKDAISSVFFDRMEWHVDSRGRVFDKEKNKIYGPGYVTGIEKIISIHCQ